MPYRSQAQRKKLHALAAEGKVSQAFIDEADAASKGKRLPERIRPKKKAKK